MVYGITKIDTYGAILHTEHFGNCKNPAILLIAGAMAPCRFWTDTLCSFFAEHGFFVIRYDHRDAGLSSSVDFEKNPYSLDDMANDATAILHTYSIKKAHIIGHSVGSLIALLFALKYPKLCLSLTLISSGAVGPVKLSESEEKILEKTWPILLKNKPSLNFEDSLPGFLESYRYLNGTATFDTTMASEYIKDMYMRTKHLYTTQDDKIKAFEIPHNHVKAQQNLSFTYNDLQKISIPTLIIHGKDDYLALPAYAKALSQALPNASLTIVSKMGHMLFNQEIEILVAQTIVNFINSLNERKK